MPSLVTMFKERTSVLDYFRKPVDPKELVRKWQAELRTEARKTERSIREIERERKSTEKAIREAAKRNDMASAKILAREIVSSKKAVTRLYVNKAQMTSISTALSEQLAMVRVAGTLSKSADVMKEVNKLIKVPELSSTMQLMSQEMMKAGLIDEMMEDMFDGVMDEDLEEETEEEVDKVLSEIAGETLAQMAAAPRHKAPAAAVAAPAAVQPQLEEEAGSSEMDELQQRLNAIRS